MLRTLSILMTMVACTTLHAEPAKILVITGDEFHKWKETAPHIKKTLEAAGMKVDLTENPGVDLTPEKLATYDAFVLNYRDTPNGAKANPKSVWSEANKKAFLDAVNGGKGLYVHHWSSSAFTADHPLNREFEKAVAGGWRKQGNHGKMHQFTVTVRKEHPVTQGISEFRHGRDELYQNSVMFPTSEILATAWSDKKIDPKNTDKNEPIVWVATYGKGKVVENVLGHDLEAMQSSPEFNKLLIQGVTFVATK